MATAQLILNLEFLQGLMCLEEFARAALYHLTCS